MLKPVFIIGCPRSGTTLTLDLLAAHNSFAWISTKVNRYPAFPHLGLLNRLYAFPLFGKYFYHNKGRFDKIFPQPVEPWEFWNYYLKKFQWERNDSNPPRRRTGADLSEEESDEVNRAVQIICKTQGKKVFLSKYTDFPRIQYLLKAFPHAKFIHIIRDGRAVAHSYLEKLNRNQFSTWREKEWWASGWPADWRNDWISKNKNELCFVAYQWKYFIKEILLDSKYLESNQYFEFRYKDLISNPLHTINNILEFIGMEMTKNLEWYINNQNITNMNLKWEKNFSESEITLLESIFSDDYYRQFLDE